MSLKKTLCSKISQQIASVIICPKFANFVLTASATLILTGQSQYSINGIICLLYKSGQATEFVKQWKSALKLSGLMHLQMTVAPCQTLI